MAIKEMQLSRPVFSSNFQKADDIVIFLHGYGAEPDSFYECFECFFAPKTKNTVFLAPKGHMECPYVPGGYMWFPLEALSLDALRCGIDMASKSLHEYIEKERNAHGGANVTLIGFSQGAIMSFEMLYYADIKRLISLSGLFVPQDDENPIKSKDAKTLLIHGMEDDVVPFRNLELATKSLKRLGIQTKNVEYPDLDHSINMHCLEECLKFISDGHF